MQPFLFHVSDEKPTSDPPSLSLRQWIKDQVIRYKLETPIGYLLLTCLSMVMAWQIGTFGWVSGAILLVSLFMFPLLMGAMFNLRFGVYLCMVAALLLMGIKRFTGNIPLGLFLDASIIFMLFGLFIQQIRQHKWDPAQHIISLAIFIWFGYNIVELFNYAAPSQVAWFYAIRDTASRFFLFFIPLYALTHMRHVSLMIKIWLGIVVLGALYAIFQEVAGLQAFEKEWVLREVPNIERIFIQGRYRKFSFFADPGSMGVIMGASAILAMGLLRIPNLKTWQRVSLVGSIGLMLVALLLSGTRTAFLVFPLAVGFGIFLRPSKLWIGGGVAVAAIWLLIMFGPLEHPIFSRFQTTTSPMEALSFQERERNQDFVQQDIQDHPIGAGLGTTGKRGQRFSPYTLLSQYPADSGFVQIGIETGWLGLLIYCGFLFLILAVGVRNYFRTVSPLLKVWYVAILASMMFLILTNYAQPTLVSPPMNIFFILCMSLLVILRRLDNEDLTFKVLP
ncbi:MAG: O-antigen ligase family protein [Bacteroidota bacterium]